MLMYAMFRYLRKIIVRDVKTGKEWYFFCGTWFSVTYEKDPCITRWLFAATEAEKVAWRRRFVDRIVDEFNNSHLWLSVFFRLPTSNFTRCQRLACSVAILSTYLLLNIMWHGYPTADYSEHLPKHCHFSRTILECLQLPFQ
jgi:hypothetical protein